VNQDDWKRFREALREDRRRADQMLAQMFARSDKRWDEADKRELLRHKEVMAQLADQREKTDRLLAESHAHTNALLAVLDRLNGGGGPAPAT
jgi:hypothetical protein